MTKLTITEALAEIKTIGKRTEKKREFIKGNLARQELRKDPLHADGGGFAVLSKERQSLLDLEERIVRLRRAIQAANDETSVMIGSRTRTISGWLTWRREVAPGQQKFLGSIQAEIAKLRKEAQAKGVNVVAGDVRASADTDLIINLNERELAGQVEEMELILGTLDGLLSLKNATTFVEVED